MKKTIRLVSFLITTLLLVACGDEKTTNNPSTGESTNESLSIYTTVYPLQYFAERIGGDYVNVSSIYPPGSNEHTFEPTQKAMIELADADLFFYIGLGLEGFVEKAETTLKGEHVKFIPTAANVSEDDLHISTGHTHAEAMEEHDHEDEDAHEEEHHHDGEHDAHVWLSPVISKQLAEVIQNELASAMPEQKDYFKANFDELVVELDALHTEFTDVTSTFTNNTFFVSHAAFGYIAGHYNLKQVPVAGLNSQSEPSQKELAKIVDLAKHENIQAIYFEQNVSSKLTKVIQEEIGAKAITLHNLSVRTEQDIKNNEDYFTLMRANLKALKETLR